MVYFSFKKGKKLARIDGGKYDGKIIYVSNEKKKSCCDKCSVKCNKNDIKCCKLCKSCIKELDKESEKIKKHVESFKKTNGKNMKAGDLDKLEKVLTDFMKDYEDYDELYDEIIIDDEGIIQPLPSDDVVQGDIGYIAGPKGSGKSTFVGKYSREYQKMFGDRDIIILSKHKDDKSLGELKNVINLPLENLLENPLDDDEIRDSLMICDDIDAIKDKESRLGAITTRDDVLENGRHSNTYILCTSHLINNSHATKKVVNECDFIVVFPKTGGYKPIKYYFETYAGLDRHKIKKYIMDIPDECRWVYFRKIAPQLILWEKGARFISKLSKD